MKIFLPLSFLLILSACQPSGTSGGSDSAETSASFLRNKEPDVFPRRNNTAPIVNAGNDINVEDSDRNGFQLIQLSGSASDAQNNIVTYKLYKNDVQILSSSTADIFQGSHNLQVGSYNFKMEAIDARGLIGSDSVLITVKAPVVVTNTAPVVNAGADISRVDSDNNGSENITLAGSASDAQNNITSYRVLRNGVQVAAAFNAAITVPVGSHTIVMEATDAGGLKGSDTMMINITAPVVANTAPVVSSAVTKLLTAAGSNNMGTVTLQGSARDAEGNIKLYQVKEGSTVLKSSSTPDILTSQLTLPAGTHDITLSATDAGNLSGSVNIIVSISGYTPPVSTNTAPVVSVGSNITVTDMDKNGSEMVSVSASASDAQNNISVYRLYQNNTLIFSGPNSSNFSQSLNLMVGTHTIRFEAEDAGGLKGSASMTVTVNAGPVTVPSGTPPIANAGQDISTVNIDPVLGKVGQNVIGSASAGSNPIVSYVWKVNGVPYLKSSSPAILTTNMIYFIKGTNLLELEVTDSAGLKGVDSAIVEVKPGLADNKWFSSNNIIPGVISISAGGDRVFLDKNNDNSEPVRMVGSINSVNPISIIRWTWHGMILAEGSTPDVLTRTFSFPIGRQGIVLTVIDNKGNTVTDHFTASVGKDVVEQVAKIPSTYDINSFIGAGSVSPIMWKEESSFRFRCKASHISYDDPIVYPGVVGGAHMHLFFGNTKADANSTYVSLRSNGDGTCDGGPNNRSAYWMPTVLDGNGSVVLPDLLTIYYKRHPGSARIPRGLKMVFGYDSRYPTKGHNGKWYCDAPGTTEGQKIVDVGNCPASTSAGKNQIYARIGALNCWDGKNLDSPDHRSHMAACDYSSGWGTCECPATHPVDIPAFTMLAAFSHNGFADFSKWRLSSDHVNPNDPTSAPLPGGSTLHADWFGAWDDNVMDMWMDGCINQHLNCSGGLMGLGKALKENAGFSFVTVPNRINPPVKPIP